MGRIDSFIIGLRYIHMVNSYTVSIIILWVPLNTEELRIKNTFGTIHFVLITARLQREDFLLCFLYMKCSLMEILLQSVLWPS